jgi:HrpA-like RNA helicase
MNTLFSTLSDLPMTDLLLDITNHINTGGVALVISETGSGKTLLTPAAIHAETGESVLTCEPSRFLTMNAATIISDITQTKLGELAGYSVGIRGRDAIKTVNANTPLVFQTYGMAVASQSILTAQNIVLDEAHDPQMDGTIVAAIVKKRMKSGIDAPRRLVVMSATMSIKDKMEYWKDFNPKVFQVETGLRFKCQMLWEPATPESEAVMKLIEMGKKGILVFAPGVGEIQKVQEDLEQLLAPWIEQHPDADVELLQIHSGTEYEDRVRINAMPDPGCIRILIGTNVMESGISLSWVDAGVSMGLTKELHVARESGATALHTVPMTQSSLQQQSGRTNRFCDSVFILCGPVAPEKMITSPTPEILRVPLTTLHMHCAAIGVDPSELEFDPQPDLVKFRDAVTGLQHLGFIDETHKLTPAGEFALQLPVGLETAALLWQAKTLDILPQALKLAAVFEVDGIRKDNRFGHSHNSVSDHLDGLLAFTTAERLQNDRTLQHAARVELMLSYNIGKKKFDAAREVLVALCQSLNISSQMVNDATIPSLGSDEQKDLFDDLRQCLLAATIDRLGHSSMNQISMMINPTMSYAKSSSSEVDLPSMAPVSAKLRRITPRNPLKRPFTIAEMVTVFTLEDFKRYNDIRTNVVEFSREFVTNRVVITVFGRQLGQYRDTANVLGDLPKTSVGEGRSLSDILTDALNRVSMKETPRMTEPPLKLVPVEPKPQAKQPPTSNSTTRDSLVALRDRFKFG